MSPDRILLVDDEPSIRFGVGEFLRTAGYVVDEADGFAAGLRAVKAALPDAVVLDYSLGDGNGLDLLRRLRAGDGHMPIIMLTAHGTIELAVQAMKEGAEQFLTKPVDLPALGIIVERALHNHRREKRGLARKKKEQREQVDPFRGRSPVIQKLCAEARRLLPSDRPIFIHGETGSGKGVLAHWLHDNGPRSGEAFVDLNCAGLSRDLLESELFGHERGAFTGALTTKQGLLEIAHRGTVFLDEVGDMEASVQAKLLKVLEDKRYRRLGEVSDRQVDVRLVTATHHDLESLVAQGKFREDLFYRIRMLPLVVPPLRDRRDDIAELAREFALNFARELGRGEVTVTKDAVAALEAHRWPGNVRELRNVVERAVLLAEEGVVDVDELGQLTRVRRSSVVSVGPSAAPSRPPESKTVTRPETLADLEREHIIAVLHEEGGRVEHAARRLGIPRSSLYYKLKRYGVGSKD